jgi:tetratricopeptide (TPR) repeat protein
VLVIRRDVTIPTGTDPWAAAARRQALARAMDEGCWRRALILAETSLRIDPDDGAAAAARVVSLTESGRNGRARRAADELRMTAPDEQATWSAVAAVVLADGDWVAADRATRRALELAPASADAWAHRAAALAGIGHFDEAAECLERAEEAGGPKPYVAQRVGRAVNLWALRGTHSWPLLLLGFVVVGVLAVALGVTAPFVVRELRVRRLGGDFRERAERAWAGQHRQRVVPVLTVVAVLLIWVTGLAASAG